MKRAQILLGVVVFVVTLPWTIPRVQTWAYSGPTMDSVLGEMETKLSAGDPEARILEVLDQLEVNYSFDDFGKQYKGNVPGSRRSVPAPSCLPGSMESHVWVEVHVDDQRRYVNCEVLEIGTFW